MVGSELLAEAAEFMPGFLYIYEESPDGSARFIYASERVEELLAVSREELLEDASAAWARGHPDDLADLRRSIDEASAAFKASGSCKEWRCDFRVLHPDRGEVRLQGRSVPKQMPNGSVRWFGFHHDISEMRAAQEALKLESDRAEQMRQVAERRSQELEAKSRQLDQFFELSNDLLAIWNFSGGASRMSQGWAACLGYSTHRLHQMRYAEVVHPDDLPSYLEALDSLASGRNIGSLRTRWVHANKHIVTTDWRATVGDDGLAYVVAQDVSKQLAAEKALNNAKAIAEDRARALAEANRRAEYAALHDSLTGLPNRRYLEQVLAERRATGSDARAALHLDLDDFKEINDRYGHAVGDEVLRRSAAQLSEHLEEGDFLARAGGDEFVIVSKRLKNPAEASAFADKLIRAVASPFFCGDWLHRIGVSVGVAVGEIGGSDADALLADADIALYRAKAAGGRRAEVFGEWMRMELRRRKAAAESIEAGLQGGEFEPYYQPQICARTGEVAAVEALARWRHPIDGLITPDRFIPAAEEIGLTGELDRRILHSAFADLDRLQEANGRALRLSVNVSARRLAEPGLVDEIRALGPKPGMLCFELVESILFDDADDAVIGNIRALREGGVDIELDDFGSGHASIIALTKLRPTRLKIDRRLVAPVVGCSEAQSLVRCIVDIGRSLGVGVVAEGVESFDHAWVLAKMGCTLLQGYAFARPAPFSETAELLEERPWAAQFGGVRGGTCAAELVETSIS